MIWQRFVLVPQPFKVYNIYILQNSHCSHRLFDGFKHYENGHLLNVWLNIPIFESWSLTMFEGVEQWKISQCETQGAMQRSNNTCVNCIFPFGTKRGNRATDRTCGRWPSTCLLTYHLWRVQEVEDVHKFACRWSSRITANIEFWKPMNHSLFTLKYLRNKVSS